MHGDEREAAKPTVGASIDNEEECERPLLRTGHTRKHGIPVALVPGVIRSGLTTRTTTGPIVHAIQETAARDKKKTRPNPGVRKSV